MRTKSSLLAVVVVVTGLIAWYLVVDWDPEVSPASSASTASGLSSGRAVSGTSVEGIEATDPRRKPVGRIADSRSTVLMGRCVSEAGAPQADVDVTLRRFEIKGGQASEPRDLPWIAPPSQATQSDGRFLYRLPQPPQQVAIAVHARGFVPLDGRVTGLVPGVTVDLGDLKLIRGCQIRGRVVDTDGLPRADRRVRFSRFASLGAWQATHVAPRAWHAARTDADGGFVLPDLVSPGAWSLDFAGTRVLSPKNCVVPSGQATWFLEIVVVGDGDALRGVVVDERGAPLADAEIRTRTGWQGTVSAKDGSFRLEKQSDRDRGAPQLRVSKGGFEVLEPEETYPWGSTDLRLEMTRTSGLRVRVTNAVGGEAVEDYALRVVPKLVGTGGVSMRAGRLRNRGPHKGGQTVVEGLVRGSYFLSVMPGSDDLLRSRLVPVEIGPAHPDVVHVEVSAAVFRTLRVESAAAKPVAGTRVELLEPVDGTPVSVRTSAGRMDSAFAVLAGTAHLWYSGVTDESGQCELIGPGERPLAIRVLGPGHVAAVRSDVVLDAGTGPIVVTCRRGATLVGRMQPIEFLRQLRGVGQGALRKKIRPGLYLSRVGSAASERVPAGSNGSSRISREGTFEISGIPPGSWRLHLSWLGSNGAIARRVLQSVNGLQEGERRQLQLDMSDLLLAEVIGRVLVNGKPPRHGTLYFREAEGASALRTESVVGIRADGKFRATIFPGRYTASLHVLVAGHRIVTKLAADEEITLSPGQTKKQMLHVRSTNVEFLVLGPDAKPRSGVGVMIEPREGEGFQLPLTDSNGRIAAAVGPGPYTALVMPEHLTAPTAWQAFMEKIQNDPERLRGALIDIGRFTVAEANQAPIRLTLPKASGY